MRTVRHSVEFCVIGGGLAGLAAAVSAARRGVKTLLVQDRPVLGGNASSEIRMWVCGAHGSNRREGGIVEELELENLYRNPEANYSIWDEILYGKARAAENLELLLNTACVEARLEGSRLRSVAAWQLTSETRHEIEAVYFADCSGDSIVAALTGVECRLGREARAEFGESIEPETADRKTMGMSCMLQGRETNRPVEYIPPEWATHYRAAEDFPPNRGWELNGWQNFWWLEVGGAGDVLHDADANRDELLSIAFGAWDFIKNRSPERAQYRNWELDWVGFLPGKRESRRYIGLHTLTQNEVQSGGRFADLIAYGGWTMDDHHPDGIHHPGQPTTYHQAPSPYGIPYGSICVKEIENLWCAGRNISVTHAALSSTRVMATCALLGQAAGTACAVAKAHGVMPAGVAGHIAELQQLLMTDDCWLPGFTRAIPELSRRAVLTASNGRDPEPLRDGCDRMLDDGEHAWRAAAGDSVTYDFGRAVRPGATRLVFDSDFNRGIKNSVALRPLGMPQRRLPGSMARDFNIEYRDAAGEWHLLRAVRDNWRRLATLELGVEATALRFTLLKSWGDGEIRIFSWDVA